MATQEKSQLYQLPPEIRDNVAQNSDTASLKNLMVTSNRCRELFAVHLFNEVHFQGDSQEVSQMLNDFISNEPLRPSKAYREHHTDLDRPSDKLDIRKQVL